MFDIGKELKFQSKAFVIDIQSRCCKIRQNQITVGISKQKKILQISFVFLGFNLTAQCYKNFTVLYIFAQKAGVFDINN